MVLIERETLVERIGSAIEAARGGAGALIALSGEAGAGKTSLVREAVASASALWGYCEPLSTPRPLGPFRDIARQIWSGPAGSHDLGVVDMRERLLEWVRDAPVPLVIEDGHWIDDGSADVLRFLGRRVQASAGLIVVTFRDELSAEHPLRPVLGELASATGFVRIDVPPLTSSAVAQLVSGTSIDAEEAYRLTNGNAFLVSQLGLAPGDRTTASVRDAVAARVIRLSGPARAVVELLSVMPGRVRVSLLGADLAHLDEAVVGGLVRVDGPVVEFRHELVRLAVEQELPPGRRRELHADVLRRMSALGDGEPAAVAFHAREALDLRLAYTSERAAAERAVALGSHGEAAEHYRRAVADAAVFASPAERSQLWLASSREEYLIGRDGAAMEAARRAVELRPDGTDPLLRGVAVRWLSRMAPSEAESHRLGMSAIEILEPLGPSPELAAAYACLAMSRMVARDLTGARPWAKRAIDLATELGDTESLVGGLQALGAALTLDGEDPSGEHLRRAVRLAQDAGLDEELGRLYANLVSAAGEARLYQLSSDAADEALDYFVAQDLDAHTGYTRAWHARCLFEQGRWSEATTWLDAVLHGANQANSIAAVTARCVQGRLRARRGDPQVWEPLDAAGRIADITGTLQRIAPVAAARAEARWLAGEGEDGTSGLTEAYELALTRSDRWAIGELGLWMWRHGLLATLPQAAAEPYRLHVNGDPVAAGRTWLAIGCPYEAADAWCDSADERSVRAALDLFTDLGAWPGRQRAARRLRELGVRSIPRGPRATTAEQPDGLTTREQEVLRWVRAGHTDAEIAAKLHLSTRTVGHHVSAVLRKTQSRSRRELQQRAVHEIPRSAHGIQR